MTGTTIATGAALFIIAVAPAVGQEPTRKCDWQQMSCTAGGVVGGFVVGPAGDVFAGTFDGGVFVTTDNGASWRPRNEGLAGGNVTCMGIADDGELFAGTYGLGVFRSNDGGASWIRCSVDPRTSEVTALAVTGTGSVIAGTSRDGLMVIGAHGTRAAGLSGKFINAIAVTPDGIIYAATAQHGVFRSRDDGATWVRLNLTVRNGEIRTVAVISRGTLFAGTNAGTICRSVDGGDHWTIVARGPGGIGCIKEGTDGALYAGTRGGILRSVNGGDTWQRVTTGLRHIAVRTLTLTVDGNIFAGLIEGGIFRSAPTQQDLLGALAN